ncbi:hypothetical protein PVAND_008717 [Polypedilum vanderplanki]|uniref:ADP-ribosylation factor-like protein 4A n=1 Tax=Polypedilum vanderplanki TaxID=319348 RepID=A0A9J6CB39_POLVA|nr:hypothetical protein PVAND_008717 [Polypedilum vanderplanki]
MGATLGRIDSSSQPFHVCLLGLDSAGKTTALYRMKFDQYINTVPTIGFNCEKIKLTTKGISFLIWDVGGQEKIRALWKSYWRCTDGIIFVVDSCDLERMEEAKMELMKTAKCPDNHGTPILILANKQDLPSAKDINEMERLLSLHELTTIPTLSLHIVQNFENNSVTERTSSSNSSSSGSKAQQPTEPQKLWHVQATCAVTGEGLTEGLEHLYEMIVRRRKLQKQKKKR